MKKIFITGGAGFIGTNAAKYFSKKKWQVYVFDNLSRKGTTYNIRWLKKNTNIIFIKGDIRNFNNLSKTLTSIKPEVILHCAGQVAVTTSFINPMYSASQFWAASLVPYIDLMSFPHMPSC